MTLLKATFKCDICGVEKKLSKGGLKKWEHCLEIKRGFRMKPVDICPKCIHKPPPRDRIFMRTILGSNPDIPRPPNMDKYMA